MSTSQLGKQIIIVKSSACNGHSIGRRFEINGEISGYSQFVDSVASLTLEEQDFSLRKLGEYQSHLRTLQKEKSEQLDKVLEHVNEVHSMCSDLGLDFGKTINEVHPSLEGTSLEQATNISDSTLEALANAILKLKTEKKVRFQKLKDIASSLFELWQIMDSTRKRVTFQELHRLLDYQKQKLWNQRLFH